MRAARIAVLVALAFLLVWFARHLDAARLAEAFEHAALWPLAIGLAIPFASLWAKATTWRVLLAPHDVPIRRLWRYTVVAFAGSALAPARAGELLRLWSLKQREHVPVTDSAAVAVSEKVLDGLAMFVVMAPLPFLVAPGWIRTAVLVGFAVSIAAVIALGILSSRVARDDASIVRRFVRAMHVLRDPRGVVLALAPLVAAWLFDIALVELVLHAFGIAVPPSAVLVVLLAINLAIIVPTTPGQVGVHEAGAVAGLSLYGIAPEQAITFAVTYHAIQIIPIIIAGLALEWRLVVGGTPS